MTLFPDLAADLSGTDNEARVIVFEDIALNLHLGAFEAERHSAQRVLISAEVLVRPADARHGDRLDKVVGYHLIHDAILALEQGPHIDLQETLADAVARICFEPAEVAAVKVYVRKLDVYPDCRSVGIRIVRSRPRAG